MSFISGPIASIVGADSSRSATNKQVDANLNAQQIDLKKYEEGRADQTPWREAGQNALQTLQQKIAAGPGDYKKSPGYDFRMGEGTKAINNSAAARGGAQSGAASKALTRFGQDYATGDYQNFLGNYYQSLAPLQSLAGQGMTTANASASNANNVGANMAQNAVNIGNAQAAGTMNASNAITGNLSNMSNAGVNNYMMYKYLNGANTGAASTYGMDTIEAANEAGMSVADYVSLFA
jgi:hypothetical protein